MQQKFSVPSLLAHLDMSHNDVSTEDKSEILNDFEIQLRKLDTQNLRKIERQKNAKKDRKQQELNKIQLENLRKQSLKILSDKPIKKHIIKLIETTKSLNNLKKILTYRIDLEYKSDFDKAKLDYHSNISKPNKKAIKKVELKVEKSYHDETKESIRPIYTPMGNKR